LGPVDLKHVGAEDWDVLSGWKAKALNERGWANTSLIHWVIAGGESGAHARPMNPQWVRWLRDDCLMAGIPFHFKQYGEWAPASSSDEAFRMVSYGEVKHMHTFDDGHIVYRFGKHKAGRIPDGRTWDEFPNGV